MPVEPVSVKVDGPVTVMVKVPFAAVFHDRHKGYNAIGCRRAGLDDLTIHALRRAFRKVHSHRSARLAALELRASHSFLAIPEIGELVDFIESTRRGIQPSASG